jgi:1,4-dihydroxy-2-naphthoate octaprenyltransferase
VWLLASRPATLPAAAAPVLVGGAAGARDADFRPGVFIATLAAALLIQIGTNLANDVSDYERGADSALRLGPPRVTQSGLVSAAQVRLAALAVFSLAAALGLYLATAGGWPILVIGALALVSAVTYTGGPWPFGYHGLGDLFVFVFFGIVAVTGTYYLQTDRVSGLAFAASVPVAMTVTAILVVNNLRDIPSDRLAGKRTLAVIIGAPLTRLWYALLALGPYGAVIAAVAIGVLPAWCLIALATAPLAVALVRTVASGAEGAALNGILKRTAQLHLGLGGALALGLLL